MSSDVTAIREALQVSPVFSRLDPDELDELAGRMGPHRIAAGAVVHEAGEPAAGLDVLVAGTVFRDDPTLATLGLHSGEISDRGEVFSKGAVLLPAVHRNRLRAVTDVTIARLPRDAFLDALAASRPCAQHLLDALIAAIAADIREVNETAHRLIAD